MTTRRTCLGFEWLLQMTSRDWQVLDLGYDAMNLSLALQFTPFVKASELFGDAPDEIVKAFAERNMTLNNHDKGIQPKDFYEHPQLGQFFHILATNVDRRGVPFVSAIEAKRFRIFGVQFHPEKNMFEWGTYPDGTPYEVIDHAPDAIQASQYLANFFVDQARRNTNHGFHSAEQERNALIYNYHAFMTTWPDFVQSYLFSKYRYPPNDPLAAIS